MDRNIFLLSLTVNGIKNLDTPITLEFYKKGISKFNRVNYNVKGIFGPNGIGKTAVLKGIEIIKNIIIKRYYLTDTDNIFLLNKLINKNIKKFEVEIDFLIITKNSKKKYEKYRYGIELKIKEEDVVISRENIRELDIKDNIIKKEFIVKNGNIITNTLFKSKEVIKEASKNLLDKRSILNIIPDIKFKYSEDKEIISKILFFFYNTYIKTDKYQYNIEDMVNLIDTEKRYDIKITKSDKNLELIKNDLIRKTKFIKLFKRDLESITIEEKNDDNFYYLNLFLNYKDKIINYSYESQGIKFLFALHFYFEKLLEGGIIFIDEIDISIHDIYLNKLIEFFSKEGKGQLIFTAHNITLLNTLKKYKYSMDFINENKEVVPWIKNGNSSPFNKYKEGYIKGLPFNIEESDFCKIFSIEGD